MKDPNLDILNSYKDALADLTVGEIKIPVYSKSAPLKNVPKKYVILSSQTKAQNKTKCNYWYECTITVQIVTRYPNGTGDLSFAILIGEEISQIIQENGIDLVDFHNIETMQNLTTDVILETDTENIYQYILIFNHKLNII
jgi:pyridoxal/pyridoxine/pyridoxamine kinase